MPHAGGLWARRVCARRRPSATRHQPRTALPGAVLLTIAPFAAHAEDPTTRLPSIVVSGTLPAGEAARLDPTTPVAPSPAARSKRCPTTASATSWRVCRAAALGSAGREEEPLGARPAHGLHAGVLRRHPAPAPSRSFELMNMSSLLAGEVTLVRNPSAETEADGVAGRIVGPPARSRRSRRASRASAMTASTTPTEHRAGGGRQPRRPVRPVRPARLRLLRGVPGHQAEGQQRVHLHGRPRQPGLPAQRGGTQGRGEPGRRARPRRLSVPSGRRPLPEKTAKQH